jgi:class 3 adenylate cyclase
MNENRRLAAIMFTDIVGYTALMGKDEDKAFDMLKQNHDIHEILIKKFNGTLITDPVNDLMIAYPQARLQKGIPAGSTTPPSLTR